jgi:hypothetical protein
MRQMKGKIDVMPESGRGESITDEALEKIMNR